MKFHDDGLQPNKNQIFVFGSNLAGIHGAGAAKQAQRFYGAKSGCGIGLRGRSYAIPTKNHDIETLPLTIIEQYVQIFTKFTLANPEVEFFVTKIGTGLAGFKDKDIAPFFRGCGDNCDMAIEWQPFLQFN